MNQDWLSTGSVQTFTAPVSGWYEVHLWGAMGGADTKKGDNHGQGGKGGYTTGLVHLSRHQKIYVCIGEPGYDHKTAAGNSWNGGGNPGPHGWSGSGGGASDIRTESAGEESTDWRTGLSSRILVAGGGGGGSKTGNGGYGGGVEGQKAKGGAGTQTQSNGNGGFGYGGTNSATDGGGGGSGWYGGGSDNTDNGGGGGGSGYCGGTTTNPVTNGRTIPGNADMPTTNLQGIMTGNSGPCYTYFYFREFD